MFFLCSVIVIKLFLIYGVYIEYEVEMVKIICAWCDKDMGDEEGSEDVRYSVCRTCLAKFNVLPQDNKANNPDGSRKERIKENR